MNSDWAEQSATTEINCKYCFTNQTNKLTQFTEKPNAYIENDWKVVAKTQKEQTKPNTSRGMKWWNLFGWKLKRNSQTKQLTEMTTITKCQPVYAIH